MGCWIEHVSDAYYDYDEIYKFRKHSSCKERDGLKQFCDYEF